MAEGLAIFGGTFDPVHEGHLAAAREALVSLPVMVVRFVPAGRPPHKLAAAVTPARHRLRMLELALADCPEFELDDREMRRRGPSFTVDTLEELHRELPGRPLYLLIGGDNAPLLAGWHRSERVRQLATIAVVARPGEPPLPQDQPGVVQLCDPVSTVSSSEVRRRLRQGRTPRDLLPAAVAHYIARHRLYRSRQVEVRERSR